MATTVIDREAVPRRWRLRLPERLPNLTGEWLTAYSLLWTALLAVALVGSIGGAAILAARSANGAYPWAAFGLDVTGTLPGTHHERAGTVRKVAGSDAAAANIRVGDLVLAVDGRTVPAEGRAFSSEWTAIDETLAQSPKKALSACSSGKATASCIALR